MKRAMLPVLAFSFAVFASAKRGGKQLTMRILRLRK